LKIRFLTRVQLIAAGMAEVQTNQSPYAAVRWTEVRSGEIHRTKIHPRPVSIAGLVLWSGVGLVSRTTRILFEATPAGVDTDELTDAMTAHGSERTGEDVLDNLAERTRKCMLVRLSYQRFRTGPQVTCT
jgi:hypothetical protein